MRSLRSLSIAAAWLTAAATAPGMAQGSPCLSNPDTAAAHIGVVTRAVTYMDSTVLANQGLPYRPPEGVTLITDPIICQRVIDADNALIPPGDTVAVVTSRAYVLRVGTTAYALIPEQNQDVYIYYHSTTYTWLAGMVAAN